MLGGKSTFTEASLQERKPHRPVPMSAIPPQALFQQALALHQAGRLAEAEAAYRQIMRADPRDYPSRCMLGRLRVEQGRHEEAEKILESALQINDAAPQGLAFYGVALLRQRKFDAAAAMFERAIAAAPHDATQRRNLGDALRGLQRYQDALNSYDEALQLDSRLPEVLACRAETLMTLGRYAEALASSDAALALASSLPSALSSRAAALAALERNEEAVAAYRVLLRHKPNDVPALGQRAHLLALLQRYEEAIADFNTALNIEPRNAHLLMLRGMALAQRRQFEPAVASYDAAVAIDATQPELFFHRALALEELGALEPAVDSYDRALALRPDYIAALNNRSGTLGLLRRFGEARAGMERILAAEPDHIYAFGGVAHCMLNACDWSRREEIETQLRERILAAKVEIPPGTLLAYLDDPQLQLLCARNHVQFNVTGRKAYDGPVHSHDRLRIAYLSADFHEHPTARLAVELFERHDRARFEIFALSFGANDDSAMRARLKAAFEHFHDVRAMNNADILALMRQLEIDIAVDLKGYTQDARAMLFAQRAAPVQVNYLGFPGTLGADFYDYVLADSIVAPMELQPFFDERIVHLPQCYQPNDSQRAAPPATTTRNAAGLPETGLVFCCFNNNFKIAPIFFDVWMRLLHAVDGSVLWLLEDNPEASTNLRSEAKARGIDPRRLVFAPRVAPLEHLARHHLADLFLDTLPYGAHTTASDALWMGVPIVTCLGKAFAGRVGASLCHAVGLQELVARDLAEYEAIALSLARDSRRLTAIKTRLAAERMSYPLFDSRACARGIEAAFTSMWKIHQSGRAAEAFAVTL